MWGQEHKITPEIANLLVEIVEETPEATLQQLKDKLFHDRHLSVSTFSISRILDKKLITLKNLLDP